MFDDQSLKPQPDYRGVKLGALMVLILLMFAYIGKAEVGLTVSLSLGVILLAILLNWKLRKHVWFWTVIVFITALHIPLILWMRWPDRKAPAITYVRPFLFLDYLIIAGTIQLAKSFLLKDSSSDEDDAKPE